LRVEAKQVSEIFKLNDNGRSAQKWAKEKRIKAKKNGKKWLYEIDDVIQFGYENGYIDIELSDKDELPPNIRKDLADAELKEFKLAVEKGKYYSKEEIETYIQRVLVSFRNKTLGLASKIAPALVALDEAQEAQAIVYEACYELLEELGRLDETM